MVVLSSLGGAGWQFLDANGDPLAGGKLYTYEAGTTTPAPTYTNNTGSIANTNPVVLDAAGRVPEEIWLLDTKTYKFLLTSSTNVTVWTKDNIPGILASSSFIDANKIIFTGVKGQSGYVSDLADSDGSDWIGYKPAGATPSSSVQDALRSLAVLTPEQFGAVGNGVADDSIAMLALGDAARALGAVRIKLTPGKTYTYTNPLFLTGVKDALVIDGWGAAFKNIRVSVFGVNPTFANNEGLVFYPIFYGLGRTLIGSTSPQYFYGEPINTVARNSATITVSSGDMSTYAVGKRVMIYGFGVQVGGFPSTSRYFEYATITNITGSTLTLDQPTKYAYSADWPDLNPSATFTGKPRVISMSYLSAQEIAYLEINGLRLAADSAWLPSAGGTINRNGRLSVGAYKQCVLNGVIGDGGMYVFQGQSFVDNNSKFQGEVEIDKYTESAVMSKVDYASYSQGTGCNLVRFQNNSLIRLYNNGDALENFEIVDSEILSGGTGAALLPGTFGTGYTLIQRCRINKTAANNTLKSDIRIAVAYDYVSDTRIDMPSAIYTGTNIHRILKPGTILYNIGGEAVFRLTNTPFEAAGRVYMDGKFLGGAYVSGNTLYAPLYPYVKSEDTTIQQNGTAVDYLPSVHTPFVEPLFAKKLDARSTQNRWWTTGPLQITNASQYLQLANSVSVTEITINVVRAYTGATTTAILRLRRLGGGATNLALIDLKTTGLRTLAIPGNYGATSGDTLTGIGTSFISSIEYFTTGAVAYASDAEAAIYYITVDGQILEGSV